MADTCRALVTHYYGVGDGLVRVRAKICGYGPLLDRQLRPSPAIRRRRFLDIIPGASSMNWDYGAVAISSAPKISVRIAGQSGVQRVLGVEGIAGSEGMKV